MNARASAPLLPIADAVLAAEVLAGDGVRFEMLVRRYNALVFRTARSVLRDDLEAEECAQRSWLTAYERLAQFDAHGSFAGWLGRITYRNALKMAGARAARRNDVDIDDESAPLAALARPSVERHLFQRDLGRALEHEIDALPISLREVFILSEVQGLASAEVGTILGLTAEHVRVRLHRAKQHLRTSATLTDYASAYAFDGARCDRVAHAVMSWIAAQPRPFRR